MVTGNPRVILSDKSGCRPCWQTFSWRGRRCQGCRFDCWLSRKGCRNHPLVPLSFRSRQFFGLCWDSKTLIEILSLSVIHRICLGTNLRILLESEGVLWLLTFRSCSCHPSTSIAERDCCSLARMGFQSLHRTEGKGCSGWRWFNWSVG